MRRKLPGPLGQPGCMNCPARVVSQGAIRQPHVDWVDAACVQPTCPGYRTPRAGSRSVNGAIGATGVYSIAGARVALITGSFRRTPYGRQSNPQSRGARGPA